ENPYLRRLPLLMREQDVRDEDYETGIAVVVPGKPHVNALPVAEEAVSVAQHEAVQPCGGREPAPLNHLLQYLRRVLDGKIHQYRVVAHAGHTRNLQRLRQRRLKGR